MAVRLNNSLKLVGMLTSVFMLMVSCAEDDLNSIDAGFIDNISFTTKEIVSEVGFFNSSLESIPTKADGQFLLGVYQEKDLNTVKGSFVSHLQLPSDIFYHADSIKDGISVESKIDDVVLYLPYHATVLSVEDNVYTYRLDSIFGIKDLENDNREPFGAFNFQVDRLETFLNPLSPDDPSVGNVLYSDADYASQGSPLATVSNFSPTASDTETLIPRLAGGVVYQTDTIRLTNNAPRIAVRLDKDVFQNDILNKLPAVGESVPYDFKSQDHFIRYFKGLYVKTTSENAASIATLPLNNAFVEMYFTNVVKENGVDTDTIAKTMRFNLGGVKGAKFENAFKQTDNPSKMFVQGTAGWQTEVQLFGLNNAEPSEIPLELLELRMSSNKDGQPIWLINEATLKLYVDADYESTDIPNRLYLHKNVPDNAVATGVGYRSQLLDYITASNISTFDGILSTETVNNEELKYYKFRLTDYITELIKSDNTKNVDNLALKLYTVGDFPTSSTDTLVNTISWDPRGVVLHAGSSGDDADVKRAVLKINYSYQNRAVEE